MLGYTQQKKEEQMNPSRFYLRANRIRRRKKKMNTTPVYVLPAFSLKRGVLESYLSYHYSGDAAEIEYYINEAINSTRGEAVIKSHKSNHVNRKVALKYRRESDDFILTDLEEV
jgi:hypothetical protein